MTTRMLDSRTLSVALLCIASAGCGKKDVPTAEAARSAAPAVSESAAPEAPPPAGCNATGTTPTELGSVLGYVYGFAGDDTSLYLTSWQLYGNRGDVSRVPKAGKVAKAMGSLELEPRGLALDATGLYFTSGIRLMHMGKEGGEMQTIDATFSSQAIAVDDKSVYGVPGDYGPYDRVVKIAKKGGESTELGSATRPTVKPPFGFSSIAVDASGIYVTDSTNDRVLRYGFEKGKPQVLAAHQAKAFALALEGDNAYFTLALEGQLLRVPKKGGTPVKISSGLVKNAPLAADSAAVYTALAGDSDSAPQKLVKIVNTQVTPVATIPASHTVEGLSVDAKCVYWVERDSDARKGTVFALPR